MSHSTTLLFRPSEPYLDALEALMRHQGNEAYVMHGVRQIVQRGRDARSLPQRNRLWLDAVHLLRRDWKRDFRPDLLDRKVLEHTSRLIPVGSNDLEGLDALTQEVLRDTWPDFDSFKRSSEGQRQFDREQPEWLSQFHDWLDRYLPLTLVPLPDDAAEAERVLAPRIEWLVDKVAPEHDDAAGYRQTLLDKAWMYARANWRTGSALEESGAE